MAKVGRGVRRCRWPACLAAGALGAALVASPALAHENLLRADAPERYTVRKGDTLWDISGRFLDAPWQWSTLWDANEQIDNPHLIYPGDTLYLYHQDGEPQLRLERGQVEIVRLSPQVHRTPRRDAIAPLPRAQVRSFLEANRIVDPVAASRAPYVIGGSDQRIISGAGDRIYIRGDLPEGQRVGLYRLGQRYTAPETGVFLGQEVETLGEARFLRQDGDIALLEVISSRQEIIGGDRVLPLESLPVTPHFQPHAPSHQVTGQILSVPGGVRFIGRLDVVALDMGTQEGIEPGHVLTVEQRGELITDPTTQEALQLPSEQAGLLMVFRAYENVSYALVMHATRSLSVGDRVQAPTDGAWLAATDR